MAEAVPLPAPQKSLVNAIRKVLDYLIQGLGADLAIGAMYANGPAWLATPGLRIILEGIIKKAAEVMDESIADNISVIVIRFQNEARLEDYNKAREPLVQKGSMTDAEYEAWKESIRRLVQRSN